MAVLRDIWEETSFQLEMRQANPACVTQEQDGLKSRKQPPYRLTFGPVVIERPVRGTDMILYQLQVFFPEKALIGFSFFVNKMHLTAGFLGLNDISQDVDHVWMFFKSELSIVAVDSRDSTVMQRLVSSANKQMLVLIPTTVSLLHTRNRRGQRIELRETPAEISDQEAELDSKPLFYIQTNNS